MILSEEYTLIIDTNACAQPFAKELCAYCTGLVDESNVGQQHGDVFYMEMGIEDTEEASAWMQNPFSKIAGTKMDDAGCEAHCGVWVNPKYGSNDEDEVVLLSDQNFNDYPYVAPTSVGIYFSRGPSDEQINSIRERAAAFFEKSYVQGGVKFEGIRFLKQTLSVEEMDLGYLDKT